ncbi:hypothetical protein, partial [uncultured Bacteroides sp.]|uniref:hypothetical protein n=1 Tax=uncultured Bacteroides sp. TaxID=162156 RepID=UPI00259150AE
MAVSSTVLLSGVFSSCVDDEFPIAGASTETTRSETNAVNTGGLIQQSDGTWMSQNCRVPIVGSGKVVTSIGGGLITVADGGNKVGNAIDTDLSNYTTTSVGVASVNVYKPIISIRDLYHTYSDGQKVGFVFKETGNNLLSLDVLNGMTIQTFKNGSDEPVETIIAKETDKNVLNLNVLSIVSGDKVADRELSFMATKEFDEVRLCVTGVKADVLGKMEFAIKYAFVGENPEIRATSESDFTDYWSKGNPSIWDESNISILYPKKNVVDDDPDNYVSSSLVGGVFTDSHISVKFNKEIPSGAQVGFYYSTSKVLGLNLIGEAGAKIYALNENGKFPEDGDKAEPGKSLLGVSLIGGTDKTFVCMDLTKPCYGVKAEIPSGLFDGGLDIGVSHYYYAFVREPVKLDPTNYFSISSEDETNSSTYKLKTPTDGTVQYEISSSPDGTNPGITKDNILYGMTEPGDYKITTIYTDSDGKQVTQTITITKKTATISGDCNRYITEDINDASITDAYNPGGGISVISKTFGSSNIIDSDYDNYATFYGFLSLIDFEPIAAINLGTPINTDTETRVGFEVQAVTGLADVSAISTYQVKIYNDGSEVASSSDGNAVNVGVLNFDNSRVRLSINISSGVTFDHIELWRKGVAEVLETQKIYNVFYESTQCVEEGPNEACMEVMTNTGHNLNIDYDKTEIGGILGGLGSGLTNLENLLDASLDTYASFYTTAGLLSGATISLTFDEQPAKQPIGFVLGGNGDLISAEVLGGFSLTVFNGDTEVGSITDFNTAGVNVISRNGKVYLEIPGEKLTSPYNRIELKMASTLSVIKTIYLRGVYTRVDSDGDGIPDCSEDQVSAGLTLSSEITHICEGEAAGLTVEQTTFSDGSEFSLVVYNRETREVTNVKGILNLNSKLITIEGSNNWLHGRYFIDVKQGETLLWNHAELYIHPTETKWKTNNSSTDWNNWDNWDNGSPWECTNVILPSDAFIYPILKDEEKNMCNFIYFEPGAELDNTPAFSENCPAKVFIDTNLEGGKYSLFSAPLNGMYTGDMFVSNTDPECFVSLNETTYPEQRFSPIIYQRFWSKTVKMVDGNGSISDVDIDQTDWSGTFNAVSTDYQPAQGFSIRPGKDGESGNYTFRFPKEHETYNFFYANGVATGDSRTIVRSSVGKFIMNQYGKCYLSIEKSGTRFLLGNPFMTHLDIREFLAQNTNVSAVEIYDGSKYVSVTLNGGNLVSTLAETPTSVAPMGAIFVKAKTAGTRLDVNLTRGMFHQKTGSTPAAFRSRSVSSRSSVPNGML